MEFDSFNTRPLELIRLSEEIPSNLNIEEIRYVRLYESNQWSLKKVPSFLKELRNLEYLYLPSYTAEILRPDDLPNNVKALHVWGDDFQLPEELFLPKLQSIITPDLKCRFKASNVPNLKALGLRNDKKTLESISQLSCLKSLNTTPIKDGFFHALGHLPFQEMSLRQCTATSLSGIENLGDLRYLHISRFRKLTTLEHLTHLPYLEKLRIQACKTLPSLSPLTEIKSLKSLIIFDCNTLQWDGIRDELVRHLEVLDDQFNG